MASICSSVVTALVLILCLPCRAQIFLPALDARVNEVVESGANVWMATEHGAYLLDAGGSIKRIPDQDLYVFDISSGRNSIWLATNHGAYRVDSSGVAKISGLGITVLQIAQAGGEVWLQTDAGVYRVNGDRAEQILNKPALPDGIVEVGGKVWVKTEHGAYRVDKGSATRIPDEDLYAIKVTELAGHIWILSDRAVFLVDGNQVKKILDHVSAFQVTRNGDSLWLLTDNGSYRLDGGHARHFPDAQMSVRHVMEADGKVWVATSDHGAYFIEHDKINFLTPSDLNVVVMEQAEGSIWLGTDRGLYRVSDGNTTSIAVDPHVIITRIFDAGGRVWLTTERGMYRIDGDKATRITGPDVLASQMTTIEKQAWLTTDHGVFHIVDDNLVRSPDLPLEIPRFVQAGNKTWLTTYASVYRVEPNISLSADLENESRWGAVVHAIFPRFWSSGTLKVKAGYRKNHQWTAYDGSLSPGFRVLIDDDAARFDARLKQGEAQYGPEDRVRMSVDGGPHTVFVSVRDKSGNSFTDFNGISIITIPSWVSGPLLGAFAWALVLVLLIALAPVSLTCHDLVMNPWLRNYGSFGLLPVLLTLSSGVRRHVLKRYMRNIRDDEEISRWQTQFVVPEEDFLPERFGAQLERRRKLILHGQSGIGKTSYFLFLMGSYASKDHRSLVPRRAIPVYLPLSRFEGKTPEQMFYSVLSKYGRLSDENLLNWFLRQGGFVILADGLNEISEVNRNQLTAFVDTNYKANWFCISSQERYTKFAWIETVGMPLLGPGTIQELLSNRLGAEKGGLTFRQLSNSDFDLYRIPQNLEFCIELLKNDKPLPRSRNDLYKAVLAPVLDSWAESGKGDYAPLLFQRAFEMLRNREAFFDRKSDDQLPDEIRVALVETKFLVLRGERFLFAHDLVRAFLAARYFVLHWHKELTDPNSELDINWKPMLEFVLFDFTSSADAEELFFLLLKKNSRLTGDLFQWLRTDRPELCQEWQTQFLRVFGENSLSANAL